MAVLITTHMPLDIEVYDAMSADLAGPLRAAAGFRTHAAHATDGGFVVAELWDSAKDHREFFDAAVAPNLPPGVEPRVEVVELRNLIVA